MKNPFFSVVVPVYNKEPHIKRSINSVLNQKFTNFELLIICDPSTDNSTKVVESFSDSRIRIFYRNAPGPGGYAARNLGILKAKANWIAFLDADDEWDLEHLFNNYKAIQKCPEAKFFGSGWMIKDPDISKEIYKNQYHKYSFNTLHKLSFKDYLKNEIKGQRPFYTSTAVIDRNILKESGGFPDKTMKRGGDVDTWLRAIYLSNGLVALPSFGAIYYRDSVNMVTKNTVDSVGKVRTVEKLISLENDKETVFLLKRFSNKYLASSWFYNKRVFNKKCFSLYKNLYFSIEPIRCSCYFILSLFPNNIINILFDLRKSVLNKWFF